MTTARPSAAGLQRRVVVLLFADLEGYTALCEDLDPEDVYALVRPLMLQLRGCAEELGAVVPGIQGDGFMAVFGAAVTEEDVGDRALAAARSMQQLAAAQRATSSVALPLLRLGLHAGEVVVSWDEAHGGELVVSGDAVNVASRVCAAAPAGGLLATSALLELVQEESAAGHDLQVRNRRMPVRVAVLPVQPSRLRQAPIATLLVNREGLRARLDELLLSAEAPARRLCLVGEVGSGKTRAVEEWSLTLPVDVLTLPIAPPGPSGGPLGLLPHALIALAHSLDPSITAPAVVSPTAAGDADADVVARAAGAVLIHGNPDPVRRRRLLRALGATIATDEADDVEQQLEAVVDVLADLPRPIVVLLDAVERQPAALSAAMARLRGHGTVLVATAREAWPAVPNLTLEPLSETSVGVLIRRLLPGCPAELAQTLRRRSGGNPLYVEQLVSGLVESGAVARNDDGTVVVLDAEALQRTPTAMRVFVGARLDRLNADQTAALRVLAVYDEAVPTSALTASLPPDVDVDAALRGLVRSHLVRTAAAGTVVLRHALIAEVARVGMSRGDALALHVSAAGELEERGSPGSVRASAEHWLAAWRLRSAAGAPVGDIDSRALSAVLTVAADWASDPRESLRWLASAHEIVEGAAVAIGAQQLLALAQSETAALEAAGREQEAVDAAVAMAGEAVRVGDASALSRSHLARARCLDLLGHADEADEALAAARAAAPADELLAAEVELTTVWVKASDRVAVLASAVQTALTRARAVGAEKLARQLELRLTQCLAEVGGPRWEASRAASAADLREDDLAARAGLGLADASHAFAGGDDALSIHHFAVTLALAEPLGLVQLALPARVLPIDALARLGRLDEAERLRADAAAAVALRPHARPAARLALASCRLRQRTGDIAAVRGLLTTARDSLDGGDLLEVRLLELELGVERGLPAEETQLVQLASGFLGAAMNRWVVRLDALAAASALLQPAGKLPRADASAASGASGAAAGVATRLDLQRLLLTGSADAARVAAAALQPQRDLAQARALDAENAGLGAVAGGQERVAMAMFGVAQGQWSALGYTVWRARAGIWASEIAGDEGLATDARHVLQVLQSPAGLEAELRSQVRALRR